MPEYSRKPITIFMSYSHHDKKLVDELKTYILSLKTRGIIDIYHDQDISTNTAWRNAVTSHIYSAQIILLMVSMDFMASGYCSSIEMDWALAMHKEGRAHIIPIILSPGVDWTITPLANLQTLPRDLRPVTVWPTTSDAWSSITESIQSLCTGLQQLPEFLQNSSDDVLIDPIYVKDHIFELIYNNYGHSQRLDSQKKYFVETSRSRNYHLFDVFKKAGLPGVTYVERKDFGPLKVALSNPYCRGVVIEGPSGVGKTTALIKAIAEIKSTEFGRTGTAKTGTTMVMLSARDPEHLPQLETLAKWHKGTVIIDDFHRLDSSLYKKMVDYLKLLADTEDETRTTGQPKKLVIVGIPQTGQTLIEISPDLKHRIDVFTLGKVEHELVLHMIENGENALNIRFDKKGGIALAANGSLNLAQYMCFHICHTYNVYETQDTPNEILCDIDAAISEVMASLSRQFLTCIEYFAAMGNANDRTSLQLLEELATSEDGAVSLSDLKRLKPKLACGIERFIQGQRMEEFYDKYPEGKNYLFFAQTGQRLVIDDPQLGFYLKNIDFKKLAVKVGKPATPEPDKVVVSYCKKDTEWAEQVRKHLRPIERERKIELWDETKISAGLERKDEIQKALGSARIAIVLMSADFFASDFICNEVLPMLLFQEKNECTTILPLLISSCRYDGTGLEEIQMVNPFPIPLDCLQPFEQAQVLTRLDESVRRLLGGR